MTDDRFLLGESREGFYVPSQIKQAWAAQLQILKEIDRVCTENGLKYFADWGTLLGAVRHGGYIPWDDDMDIAMRRDDYMKLLEIAPKAFPQGYHIQTYENQDDYWLFMGKLVAKNHMCFEQEHLQQFNGFPYIACVDIFVLDNVYMDPSKEEERRKNLLFALGVADGIVEGTYSGSRAEGMIKELERKLKVRIARSGNPITMGRIIYKEIEKAFAQVADKDTDIVTQLFPGGLKDNRRHMPKSIFEDTIRIPFEDMLVSVPLAYDYFVEKCYGNYWNIRKDGGAHQYPFFEGQKTNLKKVLDFELPEYSSDGSELIRGSEEHPDTSGSFKVLAKECVSELGKITFEAPEEAQQLAIDLGTMLEKLRGEGLYTVSLLERYCEELYSFSLGEISSGELEKTLDEIDEAVDTEIAGKKDVVFLPVLASEWKYFEPYHESCVNEEDTVVHVIPLPYYFKDYDGSAKRVCYEGEEFPEYINVEDYREVSLELLCPEIIYIQNPYDNENPVFSISRDFYSNELRKVSEKIVYIPPVSTADYSDEESREYRNMNYYVDMPGVLRADEIRLNSSSVRDMYIKKLTDFVGDKYRDIIEKKITFTQFSEPRKYEEGNKKKILFVNSIGRFFEKDIDVISKLKSVLELFKDNAKSIDVKWYIYPAVNKDHLEEVLSKLPEEKRTQLDTLMKEYSDYAVELGNERLDYHKLAEGFDAYYGDVSPVMRHFQCEKKPVMLINYGITC